jgi:hypothetical protein
MITRSATGALALAFVLVMGFPPAVGAQNAAAYRGFRLGMTVSAVALEAGIPPSAATVVFEHPMLIQELEWRPPAVAASATGVTPEPDSVARIVFGFYNGELYRIVISYDVDRTEGLTEQDVVEALSRAYGAAQRPVARIITSPASQTYVDTEEVAARWEDETSSVNLFQASYRSSFGLVIYSKKLAPLARAGIEDAVRIAQRDAPQRDIAEQKTRDEAETAAHAKARAANILAFRY